MFCVMICNMERNAYLIATKYMLYLAACAVTKRKPDADLLKDVDLSNLYGVSQRHMMTSCVAYALLDAGIEDARFQKALASAKRKAVLFEADKTALFSQRYLSKTRGNQNVTPI